MAKRASTPKESLPPDYLAKREPTDAEKALIAVNEALHINASDGSVTLSNGIVIGTKKVPVMIIQRVVSVLPEPTVPMIFIEDADREEPNYNDPDYLQALDRCYSQRIEAVQRIYTAFGTFVISVPKDAGLYRPEDDHWIEDLRANGLEPNVETMQSRYVEWLHLHACVEQADLTAISYAASSKTGVLEKEVLDAVNYFRNNAEWRADRGLSPRGPAGDGDPLLEGPAVDGAGPGGAGGGPLRGVPVAEVAETPAG